MERCGNCGMELPEEATACPRCGVQKKPLRRRGKRGLIALAAVLLLMAAGLWMTRHRHSFDLAEETPEFLIRPATCLTPAEYCFHCSCGAKGEETFLAGNPSEHAYLESPDCQCFAAPATCTAPMQYYVSCRVCGAVGTDTFDYGGPADHVFTRKNTDADYLAAPALGDAPARYYYSCTFCGEKGTETFPG